MKIEKPKLGIKYHLLEVTRLLVLYLKICKSKKRSKKKRFEKPLDFAVN
jgi:hypothetical protein